jgi:hypothetical protein
MAKRTNPYDVTLSPDAKQTLERRLCDAVRYGLDARSKIIDDGGALDFAYSLYEQQPQRGVSRDTNRYGGADLTSPIGTQMVDTLTAIAGKTIFVEPFWIAEGIGKDAAKAPAVEEMIHWRFEEMRGQQTTAEGIRQSYIEEGAVLEVCEDALEVRLCDVVKARVKRADDETMVIDGKTGKPLPEMDEAGDPVPAETDEATGELEDHVEVKYHYTETIRRGATLRLHSLKDFLFLPGHARDRRDVWGHAWRFWQALDEIEIAALHKVYDPEAVESLGTHNERDTRTEQDRTGTDVQVDHGSDKVEKELWRVQLYADLGQGMSFYIVTLSLQHERILSVRYDWLGRFRTVYLNPYPRPYSVYGYSVILHKLLTTIEGHTAWRNMNADRSLLNANKPILRLHGSMWDPLTQPFGAGEVLDVGDPRDISTMPFDDVTQHSFQREREFYEEAARIIGVSDILASVNPKVSRTLGENEMVTEQSFTRTEDPIRNIQEALEDVGELIHAIEVKTLEEMEGGMEVPSSVGQNVQLRAPDNSTPGDDAVFAFTPDMVKGRFRFKPRGSTETADPNRRVNNFVNSVKVMQMLLQTFPALQQRYASPQVADAMNQQLVDILKIRDKQAFLAPLLPPMPPLGMPMPGHPAMPPGPPQMGQGMPPPQFGGSELVSQLAAALPMGGVQ